MPGDDAGRKLSRLMRRPEATLRLVVLAACLALAAAGCTEVCYLLQAAAGQDELGYRARPLEDALADRTVPKRIRAILGHVPRVKRFAEAHGMTPTHSYEEYVALDGPAVVYVVSACSPLAFEPKNWTFPIVGDVPYLGWFHRRDALRYARELAGDGWDVDLRSSVAYSTLGWFADPVLSSMIPEGEEAVGELVDTVLHESVHATVYVPSQSPFNESLASFVADRLTDDYLSERFGPSAPETRAFRRAERRGRSRTRRMHAVYLELDELYRSALPDEDKLERKHAVLEALRQELRFPRPLTNATLAGYKTYNTGSRELSRLFDACGGSLRRMLGTVRRLSTEDFPSPQAEAFGPALDPLVAAGCPEG